MNEKLLIFDLDDTLFETKSIDEKSVKLFFEKFEAILQSHFDQAKITLILSDLWNYPFDVVSNKFQFPQIINSEFSTLIDSFDFDLSIKTFTDFEIVRGMTEKKILVTTGFKKLQWAKIEALNIASEFEEIFIDDISGQERIYKKGIFKQIVKSQKIDTSSIFVVGDSFESELKAGYELGMKTVQVAKYGQPKSEFSTYLIKDFSELKLIINI